MRRLNFLSIKKKNLFTSSPKSLELKFKDQRPDNGLVFTYSVKYPNPSSPIRLWYNDNAVNRTCNKKKTTEDRREEKTEESKQNRTCFDMFVAYTRNTPYVHNKKLCVCSLEQCRKSRLQILATPRPTQEHRYERIVCTQPYPTPTPPHRHSWRPLLY